MRQAPATENHEKAGTSFWLYRHVTALWLYRKINLTIQIDINSGDLTQHCVK